MNEISQRLRRYDETIDKAKKIVNDALSVNGGRYMLDNTQELYGILLRLSTILERTDNGFTCPDEAAALALLEQAHELALAIIAAAA